MFYVLCSNYTFLERKGQGLCHSIWKGSKESCVLRRREHHSHPQDALNRALEHKKYRVVGTQKQPHKEIKKHQNSGNSSGK
jgi:hypothetical protein